MRVELGTPHGDVGSGGRHASLTVAEQKQGEARTVGKLDDDVVLREVEGGVYGILYASCDRFADRLQRLKLPAALGLDQSESLHPSDEVPGR